MPELPEVEVTRRSVEPLVVGRVVSDVRTTARSYFFLTPPAALRAKLVGRRVTRLERRGKYLLGHLDDGCRLLLHLGMTGQLFSSVTSSPRLLSSKQRSIRSTREEPFEPDAHTHLVLRFEDGGPALLFRDVRKFGKVRHLGPGRTDPRLEKLGVDALEATGELLHRAARRRKAPIKSLLLDQSVLAGAGNIYADEALFLAGVRPTRSARGLKRRECDDIARALVRVLEAAIEAGGSSIDDFIRPDGRDGGYQDAHAVYGRGGQPCSRCARGIRRVVVAQRATHYCPHCQR